MDDVVEHDLLATVLKTFQKLCFSFGEGARSASLGEHGIKLEVLPCTRLAAAFPLRCRLVGGKRQAQFLGKQSRHRGPIIIQVFKNALSVLVRQIEFRLKDRAPGIVQDVISKDANVFMGSL